MPSKALTEVIDSIQERAEEEDSILVQDIISVTSHRALGPLILIPSLFMVSPLAGIPTLPTLCATFIIIVSWQLATGRDRVWLPERLKNISLGSERLQASLSRMRPWTSRLEKLLRPRLDFLIEHRFLGWLAIAVALTVPPLEFLPLAALGPGFILLLLALGLTTHDGLAVVLAIFATGLTTFGALYALS